MDRQANGVEYTWEALHHIGVIAICGAVVSASYGLMHSPESALLCLFASLLGYTVGGIIGFLFGFPRYTESAAVASIEDLKKTLASDGKAPAPRLRPNTNLERIVDWLMTMIVGATLVNLQSLSSWIGDRLLALSDAVVCPEVCGALGSNVHTSPAPGMLIVIPFVIGGFLHFFLWARRYLLEEWSAADDDFKRLENSVSQLKSVVFQVSPGSLRRIASNLKTLGVADKTVEDIQTRYQNARGWDDDPLKDFGLPEAGGFRLDATVTEVPSSDLEDSHKVVLKVERSDRQNVKGSVVFLLHNTFDEPVIFHQSVDAPQVTETFWCSEAFITGALVITKDLTTQAVSEVRLALDLSKAKDVPKSFLKSS